MPQSCFETFPQLFPKRQDTGKRSERVENYGKIIINTQQNAKNRIPQVLRISQYRNFRSELPKYRMKNWPLPQYRKPQCPPLAAICSRSKNLNLSWRTLSFGANPTKQTFTKRLQIFAPGKRNIKIVSQLNCISTSR